MAGCEISGSLLQTRSLGLWVWGLRPNRVGSGFPPSAEEVPAKLPTACCPCPRRASQLPRLMACSLHDPSVTTVLTGRWLRGGRGGWQVSPLQRASFESRLGADTPAGVAPPRRRSCPVRKTWRQTSRKHRVRGLREDGQVWPRVPGGCRGEGRPSLEKGVGQDRLLHRGCWSRGVAWGAPLEDMGRASQAR